MFERGWVYWQGHGGQNGKQKYCGDTLNCWETGGEVKRCVEIYVPALSLSGSIRVQDKWRQSVIHAHTHTHTHTHTHSYGPHIALSFRAENEAKKSKVTLGFEPVL